MANYNSLYYKQYFAMTEAIKRMQDIIDETDEEFMKLQKPEEINDYMVRRNELKLIDRESNLRFEHVMDIFKEYLEDDIDTEVVKFRRGYQIFSLHYMGHNEYDYLAETDILKTPDELFENLLLMAKGFYEIMYERPVESDKFKIPEDKQNLIEEKVDMWKKKYMAITQYNIDEL